MLMLPVSLLVLIPFFYAPLAGLLARPFLPEDGRSVWSAYHEVLAESHILGTTWQSFEIAGISFLIGLAVGYPLAYIIRFRLSERAQLPVLLALVLSGSVSDIVRIYAWYALLGKHGVVNEVIIGTGLTDEPLRWLLFSRFAVILVLTTGWLPYVVIPIHTSLRSVDVRHIEAARDLYAGRWALFGSLLLPMSAPGILGAFIIVFVPTLSEFATPQLVGGPSSLMLGNFISDQLLVAGDWPTAAAAASLLLLLSVGLIVAAQRLTRRIYGR
jgi:ABC-type spermidine/putrescine transport system permease subunit I